MYFKRLEIFGFKSFADKTILNFEPGITAVVGPNGCGKSNIFDSIRWVLGEQSVQELRGLSMEDVIFNGTDKKPALGFAEVSLTFSNESRMLPIEYDEVTVTRRLFRSGESEYLLNKTVVRLKDILELFMGTGIGAEAYSLIQQGKVDLVVSSRTEDRRVLLDEASGITKYKSKKREALNKLKDTENNLLRINDIILEVKRQIGSIERQANKARRYKEEFEKLKDLEIKLTQKQIEGFVSRENEITRFLEELKGQESKFIGQLEELKSLVGYEMDHLNDLEQKIADIAAQEMKLVNSIEINSRQIEFNEERLENLRLNEARLNQQKAQVMERSNQQQEKITELKWAVQSLSDHLHNSVRGLIQKKEDLKNLLDYLNAEQSSIRRDEEKILDLNSQQVRIKNELTEIIKESQGSLAQKRRLELENVKVTGEKDEVDQKFNTICAEVNSSLQKIEILRKEQDPKKQTFLELQGHLKQLEEELAETERRKVFLISRKAFIEELRVQYQDIPDPVVEGRLITWNPPSEKHSGMIGKVKEVTIVDPQKYPAFQNNSLSASSALYEIVCETKFIELDPQEITAKIFEFDQKIESVNAQKLNLKERSAKEEQQLNEMEQSILLEERKVSILEAQKNDILENSSKLLDELQVVSSEMKEAQDSFIALKHKEDDLSQRLNASHQELLSIQSQMKEKQNTISLKSQEKERITIAIAQLEAELESMKDKEKSLQENLKMFCESLEESLEEVKHFEEEKAQHVLKKEKIEQEIVEVRNQIGFIKEKKESLKKIVEDDERRKNEISQRLNSIRGEISSLEKDSQEIKNQLYQQQLRAQEIAFQEKAIKDRLLQIYKIDLESVMPLQNINSRHSEEWSDEESHREEILRFVQNDEKVLFRNSSTIEQFPLNPEETTAEIERLKKRCESYGAVNLVAIEEFEELRQRFEFLTKQQSDLLTAKESLHQTISKINRTTREMFMETFTKVSEEFRVYFRMLFGGGEAQLVLLDPQNVLESGIEIIARPPGKKLQTISLLSGGEKALTAIALIFGVFKVRPSPFCILDEIDAALDESNVGRFGFLLKDFAKIAQFIVITHNKKTISHADILYGITMQETGVSKIVSVKFFDEKKALNPELEAVAI